MMKKTFSSEKRCHNKNVGTLKYAQRSAVVLLLMIISTKTEHPLQNIHWRNQINKDYPKPWLLYKEAFIIKELKLNNMYRSLPVSLYNLFKYLNVNRFKKEKEYTFNNHTEYGQYTHVTYPLYELKSRNALGGTFVYSMLEFKRNGYSNYTESYNCTY